jgi:hypothetical protein
VVVCFSIFAPFQSQKLPGSPLPLLEAVGWYSSTGYPVELIDAEIAGAEKGSRFAEGNRRMPARSDLDAFGAEAIRGALFPVSERHVMQDEGL